MPKYKQNYITSEEYYALQQLGLEYEGFVKGLGYAYSVNISIAPPHMCSFAPPRFVPPGMDLFMYGRMQCLDSSEEAVARSYNITPEDIMNKITSVNGDGTITINIGNGQYMTLPQNNSSINITINDNYEEATLVVCAKNNLTQETRETRTKLVDLPVVFGNIGGLNQNLRLISSEGNASSGGVDGMDVANYVVSNAGTLAGGAQYGVNSMSNKQQWKYSYKAHKYLKGKGVNVQTRAIKHGANGVLKNASRKITYVGGVLAVADVAIDGELRASHILNATMVGVSAIPGAGWIIGGAYFAADMITLGVSGQSIGQHLDDAVGAPLVNDVYDW